MDAELGYLQPEVSGGEVAGQMSIPRELSIRDGRLFQQPVRELESMRANKVAYHDITFSDVITLDGIQGRTIDMELSIRSGSPDSVYQKFAVRFAQNDQYQTALSFRPHESVLLSLIHI